MNDSELDQLLKAAPVPERTPEFWELLPKRITARLHWQPRREATPLTGSRQFVPLAWALGSVAVCVVVALAYFTLRHPAGNARGGQLASAEKCFREIELLFPNQVRAVVFDERGPRMVLAEKADVPKSPALYLKICGPNGCQRVITFSGQQIRVNGDKCDVLVDAAGHVLLVGEQFIWSSGSVEHAAGRYRIEAWPLETTS